MQRSHAPSLPPAFVPCRLPRAGRPRRPRLAGCVSPRAAAADEPGEWIAQHAGAGAVTKRSGLGGSDWASFARYETASGACFFVKESRRGPEMFQGEAWGLRAMHHTKTLVIPRVLHAGGMVSGDGSFIVMEHLQLGACTDQAALGRQLALMHTAAPLCAEAAAGRFGFPVDNTIGGTPQRNGWSAGSGTSAWVDFFRDQRLLPQLALAREPALQRLGDRLCARLPALFDGLQVRPATLHGDLWSGNIAGVAGAPAVYDPASYYGHAEAEFGMSWCASFSPAFWAAYHAVLPREPGFERRAKLYQLYHYLNHYNLFGGAYYSSAASLLQQLCND